MALIISDYVPWATIRSYVAAAFQAPNSSLTMTVAAAQLRRVLAELKAVPEQRDLTLAGRDFSDRELRRLVGLRNIDGLDLCGSTVTDDGLKSVARLPSLRRLALRGTRVTSAGIQHLGSLPNLTDLDVSHTKIDDEALEVIGSMPRLKLVDLSGNELSTPAVKRIRRRSPNLMVIW